MTDDLELHIIEIPKAEKVLERLAELREKWELDERSAIANARDDGKVEGKAENTREIAKKMKEINMELENIIKVTGLTKEEIEKL